MIDIWRSGIHDMLVSMRFFGMVVDEKEKSGKGGICIDPID